MAGGCEAILYVEDVERTGGFYETCLGLRRVELGQGYRRLETAGFTLWLVRGEHNAGPDPSTTSPASRRSQVPVKLCFTVQDLEHVRAAVAGAGGRLDERVWTFGGYHRCDAVDPEGNIVQVLEPVPSD